MSDFQKFKEALTNKEKFYSSLTNRSDKVYELVTKNMNLFLMFGMNLK